MMRHHRVAHCRRSMRSGREITRGCATSRVLVRGEAVGGRATERYELLTSWGPTSLIGSILWCRRVARRIPSWWVSVRRNPVGAAIVRRPSTNIGPLGLRRPVLVGVHAFGRGWWLWCSSPWVRMVRDPFVDNLAPRRLTA